MPGTQVYHPSLSEKQQHMGQQFPLGPALLGRVLDGFGEPLDGKPLPATAPINPL